MRGIVGLHLCGGATASMDRNSCYFDLDTGGCRVHLLRRGSANHLISSRQTDHFEGGETCPTLLVADAGFLVVCHDIHCGKDPRACNQLII